MHCIPSVSLSQIQTASSKFHSLIFSQVVVADRAGMFNILQASDAQGDQTTATEGGEEQRILM